MSDYALPDSTKVVSQSLPRSSEGGMVETIKRAVVTAVREALTGMGMTVHDTRTTEQDPPQGPNPVCVDLEYPAKPVHYPGIWVQFSPTGSIKRAGIDHEVEVLEPDDTWSLAQEFEVRGRVTLSIVALKNKDRDHLHACLLPATGSGTHRSAARYQAAPGPQNCTG
jgi:hypothetical protein